MPVFLAASDIGPLRYSMVFRITVLNSSIPYSASSHWILTDASSNTVIRLTVHNSGMLQFDLYQSQNRVAPSSCHINFTSVACRLLGVAILIASSV
ncbi:hypothetical protein TNCV_4213871 [Trichonephila clavipes]|nr:hypothetical protein TNCV_4213871 [Trichonephila clavipes]